MRGQQYPPTFHQPPAGSLYPNPNVPSPTDGGIPTLSHRGLPSPMSQQNPSAPASYGYVPPVGSVPQQGYPYSQTPTLGGDEEWVQVQHGAPFPYGAIKAMDRPLQNNDRTCQECYVALWTKNGELVFGRSWNNNGTVEAWFPHGGTEHHSGQTGPFKMLIYRGPPNQMFRYAWVPINQLNSMCQPVGQNNYTPIVVRDVRSDNFNGELLGKGDLNRRMAWVSHGGKEYHFEGEWFNNAHVLCRVPL